MCGVMNDVVELPQRAFRRQRFLGSDVQRGAGDFALFERGNQRRLVHQRAARHVQQNSRRFHHERIRARPSCWRVSGVSGAARTTKVRLRQRFVQSAPREMLARRAPSVGAARTRHRPDAHAERLRDLRDFAADGAKSDEKQNLPAQLARPHRRVPEFLLRPMRLLLVAEAIGKPPGQRDEHAQNVLGHGNAMNAAGVRHFDAAFAQFGIHELGDAGGGRVDPFQFARERNCSGRSEKPTKMSVSGKLVRQFDRMFGRCTTRISGQRARMRSGIPAADSRA